MQDAMDTAFDNPEADQAADEVYNQICEEQGIAMGNQDMAVGSGAVGNSQPVGQQDAEVDDLQKRLDNLNN